MHKQLWSLLPFAATALPILVLVGFLAYYNIPSGDTTNWPSSGSSPDTIQWVQYGLLALTSLAAVIVNVIAIKKQHRLSLKIASSVLFAISALFLFVAATWLLSPTPY